MFTELSGPIRGSLKGLPVMVIGVYGDGRVMLIDSEGIIVDVLPDGSLKADVIFDYKKKEWVDLQPMSEENG